MGGNSNRGVPNKMGGFIPPGGGRANWQMKQNQPAANKGPNIGQGYRPTPNKGPSMVGDQPPSQTSNLSMQGQMNNVRVQQDRANQQRLQQEMAGGGGLGMNAGNYQGQGGPLGGGYQPPYMPNGAGTSMGIGSANQPQTAPGIGPLGSYTQPQAQPALQNPLAQQAAYNAMKLQGGM